MLSSPVLEKEINPNQHLDSIQASWVMSSELPESYRQFLENLADYPGHGSTIPAWPESFAAASPNGFPKSYGQTPS